MGRLFKSLSSLRELKISDRTESKKLAYPIFASLGELSFLESLSLDSGYFAEVSALGWRALGDYLAHPGCSLRDLSLKRVGLSDFNAPALAEGLKANSSLVVLRLDGASMVQAGWCLVMGALEESKLESLQIDSGEFSKDAIGALAKYVAGSKTLQSLRLRYGTVLTRSFSQLAKAIGVSRSLRSLGMEQVRTDREFFAEMGEALNQHPSLEKAYLPIPFRQTAPAVTDFARGIKGNSVLQKLVFVDGVSSCTVESRGVDPFAADSLGVALSKCSRLQDFMVLGLVLGDLGAASMLRSLSKNGFLESLTAKVGGASEELGWAIEEVLSKHPRIEFLGLETPRGNVVRPDPFVAEGVSKALRANPRIQGVSVDDDMATGEKLDVLRSHSFGSVTVGEESLPFPFQDKVQQRGGCSIM